MTSFDKNRFEKAMNCKCPWGGNNKKRQANKGKDLIHLFFQDLSYFRWMMETAKKDSKWEWLYKECKILLDGLEQLPKETQCLNCSNTAQFLSIIKGNFTSFAYVCCDKAECKRHLESIATSYIHLEKMSLQNLIRLKSDCYYQKDLIEYLKETWGLKKRFSLPIYKKDILSKL